MDAGNSSKRLAVFVIVLLVLFVTHSVKAQIWNLPDKSNILPPSFPAFGKSKVAPEYTRFFYSELPACKHYELTIRDGKVIDSSVYDNRYLVYCKNQAATYLYSYRNNYKHIIVECRLSDNLTEHQEFYYNNDRCLDSLTVATIDNGKVVKFVVLKCCLGASGRLNTTNYYHYESPARRRLHENLLLEDFVYNMSFPVHASAEIYCQELVCDIQIDKDFFTYCEYASSLLHLSRRNLPCVAKMLDRVSNIYSYMFENDSLVFYGEFQTINEDNVNRSYLMPEIGDVTCLYTKFDDCLIKSYRTHSGRGNFINFNNQFFVRKKYNMLASQIQGSYLSSHAMNRAGRIDTTINRVMLRSNMITAFTQTTRDGVAKFVVKRFRL